MRNRKGLTVVERITRSLEFVESIPDTEQRTLLAHMAIAEAELAIDFNLITFNEWNSLVHRAFKAV